jgi:hypothetical protein
MYPSQINIILEVQTMCSNSALVPLYPIDDMIITPSLPVARLSEMHISLLSS